MKKKRKMNQNIFYKNYITKGKIPKFQGTEKIEEVSVEIETETQIMMKIK